MTSRRTEVAAKEWRLPTDDAYRFDANEVLRNRVGRLAASFGVEGPFERYYLAALLSSRSARTSWTPHYRSPESFPPSTANLTGALAEIVESIDSALFEFARPSGTSLTIDHLFEDALPATVPQAWIEELRRARVTEDPTFSLPWIDEPDPH